MRSTPSLLLTVLLLSFPCNLATAQSQVGSSVIKWAWRSLSAAPATAIKPAASKALQSSPTLAKPAATIPKAVETASEPRHSIRSHVRKHNIGETGKCILRDRRLPDGFIIKVCLDKKDEDKRRSKS